MDTAELLRNFELLNRQGLETLRKRYALLRDISYTQPVGRRQLAALTSLSEREVRTEMEYLRMQGLIRVEAFGMVVTSLGFRVLTNLQETISFMTGRDELQEKLRGALGIQRATIAVGDCNKRVLVHRDMGLLAALELQKYFRTVHTVAISGHASVHDITEARFAPQCGRGVTVYPIRTAQMNREDLDANTHCAQLARKTGANYHLLHLGDNLSLDELEKRFHEPDACRITEAVANAELLICGVTPLKKSQSLASMSVRAQETLLQADPCCELLGSFLKADGKQVNNPPLYNLSVDQIALVPTFMLIGAGRDYVEGIRALSMRFKNMHLVTDEATAGELMA